MRSFCNAIDRAAGEEGRKGAFVKLKLPPFSGQVAQLVERSPEKAGVGGSIPSLATIISQKNK